MTLSTLPTTMRAVLLDEFGSEFRLDERPAPRPGADEVLVAVEGVGLGITNELARLGHLRGSTPRIPGHELGGRIVALGRDVRGWSEGDRVTSSFYLSCWQCRRCRSGRENLCDAWAGYFGIWCDGALADFVTVPAGNLVRVPEQIDLRTAGIVADAVATAFHAVRVRLRSQPGDTVAVVGAGGGVGVHVLQMIRAVGARAIALETDSWKAKGLIETGLADVVLGADGESWVEQLQTVTDGGPDAIVDTVGSAATLSASLDALGKGGQVIVLGHVPGTAVSVDAPRLLLRESAIAGTRYATRDEIARSLDLVASGHIRPIVGARYPLEDVNVALEAARANSVLGRIVVDVAPFPEQ